MAPEHDMRDTTAVWSFQKRLGFLILALFLVQNAAPLVAWVVPVLGRAVLLPAWQAAWNAVVPWVGEHVLRLAEPITILPNGSGDTTWNYVQMFTMAAISVIVGGAWALIDRERRDHATFNHWLKVLVRHALAASMFLYGLVKVFKSQFSFPSLYTLTQTYGDSSPMGLAWNFMGYSDGYTMFAGCAEVLAGALLLARRTTTLGALVSVGVLANIAAMNFCYDIPVKLFSSTLLLMAVYLLGTDLRRFVDLLILNRPVAPADLRPHFTHRGPRRLRVAIKAMFLLGMLEIAAVAVYLRHHYGDAAPTPPLYGLYNVSTFTVGATPRPPLTTDTDRWRRFIVERHGLGVIRTMDDKPHFFRLETDTTAHTLTLTGGPPDARVEYQLTYDQPTPETLVLRGELPDGPTVITLDRVDPNSFILVSRGFHWVNEYPFYR